jgi:hypothetical protein
MRKASWTASVLLLAGCGGPQTPEPQVPSSEPQPAHVEHHAPKMQVATELGEIDRAETIKTFDKLKPAFADCHKKGLDRVEYLEGDVKFFVRVGQDGAVRWTYLEDSTIGDLATEKCMLDAVTAAAWPKPQGGEAEVRSSTGFEPPNARPPAQWASEKIAAVVAKEGPAASKCKAGANGKFHVTAYVQPAGKQGKVQAVGVSVPSKEGAAATACIAKEVMGWTMPSPGSWAAKVSFDL